MPRKKRDIKREYCVDGRDGIDAEPYDERNLRRALKELEEARKRQP